jgi:hypothetical protein
VNNEESESTTKANGGEGRIDDRSREQCNDIIIQSAMPPPSLLSPKILKYCYFSIVFQKAPYYIYRGHEMAALKEEKKDRVSETYWKPVIFQSENSGIGGCINCRCC